MTPDPWRAMRRPPAGQIEARRVDSKRLNDFFWTVHEGGEVGLALLHGSPFPTDLRLPRTKGIEVRKDLMAGDRPSIHWILTDAGSRDLFAELAKDIIAAAGDATPEVSAIRAAVTRTWRWHRLLRAGPGGLLSAEEQKGLLGELLLLEQLLVRGDVNASVEAWIGPLAEPQDFRLAERAVEVKASRGTEESFVSISSEEQLDPGELDGLYLMVFDIVKPLESSPDSMTLHEAAERIRSLVEQHDERHLDLFEGLLLAAGFRWADDYSEHRWEVEDRKIFRVDEGFPSIRGSALPPGLYAVSYRLKLSSLGMWEIGDQDLFTTLAIG